MRGLGGRPHREFGCGRAPFGDDAAGLHRDGDVHLLVDVLPHDMRGGGKDVLVRRCPAHTAGHVVGIFGVHADA